jgi:hypothetical protein
MQIFQKKLLNSSIFLLLVIITCLPLLSSSKKCGKARKFFITSTFQNYLRSTKDGICSEIATNSVYGMKTNSFAELCQRTDKKTGGGFIKLGSSTSENVGWQGRINVTKAGNAKCDFTIDLGDPKVYGSIVNYNVAKNEISFDIADPECDVAIFIFEPCWGSGNCRAGFSRSTWTNTILGVTTGMGTSSGSAVIFDLDEMNITFPCQI